MTRWVESRAAALRDWLLLAGGLAGTGHQTVLAEVDRPWLLGLFATMMGLPYALAADRSDPPRQPEPQSEPSPASGAGTPGPPPSSPPGPA